MVHDSRPDSRDTQFGTDWYKAIARQAAAIEAEARMNTPTPTPSRIDTNRFDALDGKAYDDDDPPSDDEDKTKNGRLDEEFVRILRTAFQVKEDASHEVFQALESDVIITWGHCWYS